MRRIANIAYPCMHARCLGGNDEDGDALLWHKNLEKHSCGYVSFAVCQANERIEDYSQVEIGYNSLFVGIYDGHRGAGASQFILGQIFGRLINIIEADKTITQDTLGKAICSTEEAFMTWVETTYKLTAQLALAGSCCLLGLIWKGALYVANLGDSRVVIGSVGRFNEVNPIQLTTDHNVGNEEIREEVRAKYPHDPQIVVFERGSWRIKGVIQVSRTIGDAYLKVPPYYNEPEFPKTPLLTEPVLSADPALISRVLLPSDKFAIFASDGLWEYLTNREAVEIVHNSPRAGIAKKLVKAAQKKAARKHNTTYEHIKSVDATGRRVFHDDISVVVVFIEHGLLMDGDEVQDLSIRGFSDFVQPSRFSRVRDII